MNYVFGFLGLVGALVLFHEWGHYAVARMCGVKIRQFSVGFGPALLRWRAGEDRTEWLLCAIPLGGYVRMLDEREGVLDPSEQHRAFNRQTLGRRSAIVAAGPAANFLLAFVVYTGLFWMSPESLVLPGAYPTDELPRLGRVLPGGPAAQAGLQAGDDILSVEGVPVDSWSAFAELVRLAPEQRLDFLVAREGQTFHQIVTPQAVEIRGERVGRIGVMVAPKPGFVIPELPQYTLPESAFRGAIEVWDKTALTLSGIASLITGEASLRTLSGPVGIADYAGQAVQMGVSYYLKLLALLSISLGVFNLLPLPVLDGGHLMYHALEFFRGVPLSQRSFEQCQRIGFLLVLALLAYAVLNDFTRLWWTH